ncbi:unnamed protein product, partial [Brachionus calyciflorus]
MSYINLVQIVKNSNKKVNSGFTETQNEYELLPRATERYQNDDVDLILTRPLDNQILELDSNEPFLPDSQIDTSNIINLEFQNELNDFLINQSDLAHFDFETLAVFFSIYFSGNLTKRAFDLVIKSHFLLNTNLNKEAKYFQKYVDKLFGYLNDNILFEKKCFCKQCLRDFVYDKSKRFCEECNISGVFDKPARAMILNTKNSTAFYGCLKCLQPGKTLRTSKGGNVHVYPFNKQTPIGKEYKGIMGKCEFRILKYFNPLNNTNIDSMHTVFVGVIKTMFDYWFDSPNSKCSLKPHISLINTRLLSIRPTKDCKVAPRLISDYKNWRAKEFLNFIIYYSVIVFYEIMPFEYYQHTLCLTIVLENLFSQKINNDTLDLVNKLIIYFVSTCESMYDSFIMKSSFHELLHLEQITHEFGPLNITSMFQYEEINRKIKRLIKGADLVGEEFIKNFSICQSFSNFISILNIQDENLSNFILKNSNLKTSNRKASNNDLKYFGHGKIVSDGEHIGIIRQIDPSVNFIETVKKVSFNCSVFSINNDKTK